MSKDLKYEKNQIMTREGIKFYQFQNIVPSVSKSLDPDQAGQNVGHDLGPNCLQVISRLH